MPPMTTQTNNEDRPLVLVMTAGREPGVSHPIGRHTLILGRDPACDIPILDRRVSRQHARIEPEDDGSLLLVDNGSSNGTFVNGEQVAEQHLEIGDRIGLGQGVQLTLARFGTLHANTATARAQRAAQRVAGRAGTSFAGLFAQLLEPGADVEAIAQAGLARAEQLAALASPVIEPEEVDLAQVLAALEQELSAGGRVTVDTEPDLAISADATRISAALQQVVRSALEAGDSPVSVEAALVEPDERAIRNLWLADAPYVQITVADQGSVRLPEVVGEPLPPEGTRDLSDAVSIVRAHEGRLDARTHAGSTWVRVFLPLLTADR